EARAIGVDQQEPRAALAERLLDPEVVDGYVVLEVRSGHDDHARVIYLSDPHRFACRSGDCGAAMHLDLRALQWTVEQAAEEERLFVRDVVRQRDAERRALALDACRDRVS